MNIADTITPPRAAGKPGVMAISTTASAAKDTGDVKGYRYVSFIANQEWYIIFAGKSDATSLPDPVIATTGELGAGSVDGRCIGPFPAGVVIPFTLGAEDRYFKVIAGAVGILRFWESSPRS